MLNGLRICNFAVIDEVEVAFGPGLTVLTGETGAGKSILVDALGLLLGGRADADVIRSGADEAAVEGLFSLDATLRARLEDLGLPVDGDELSLRRVVGKTGRTKVYVNGALTTVGVLAKLMRGRVDIAGQHEHMTLFDPDTHREVLDAASTGIEALLEPYRVAYGEVRRLEAEMESLGGDERRLAERAEFLRFQLAEIRQLQPKAGEETTLEELRKRLAGAERLRRHATEADQLLCGGEVNAVELISKAHALVTDAVKVDAQLAGLASRLESALAEVEDVGRELGRYAASSESDPERLAETDERLNALKKLCRKHATDAAGLVARDEALEAELGRFENRGAELARLTVAKDAAEGKARELGKKLSAERVQSAADFSNGVTDGLHSLRMGQANFEVRVQPGEALGPHGLDAVEFFFTANAGESLRPLAKIASGGEASRILLSLRRHLSAADGGGSYVLDEADSGVSGAVADVVGQMMKDVSANRQVLCITHLAQVAAYGDVHLSIRKSVERGRTVSRVVALGADDERTHEIARMLSGVEVTREALGAAEALMRSAHRSRRTPDRNKRARRSA